MRGRVRSTWPAAVDQGCRIGFDATGQTSDPSAATIEWSVLPAVHGRFVEHRSRPIRPESDSISVWLRASSSGVDARFPFRAEFDDFSLREVDAGVPRRAGPVRESDGATR